MEFCSMLCGTMDGRGVWGRTETCTCMAESLKDSPETIITLLITYTSIQNKKFKVWKKKKISLSAHRREAWGAQHSQRCSKLGPLEARLRPGGWLGAHPGDAASTHRAGHPEWQRRGKKTYLLSHWATFFQMCAYALYYLSGILGKVPFLSPTLRSSLCGSETVKYFSPPLSPPIPPQSLGFFSL